MTSVESISEMYINLLHKFSWILSLEAKSMEGEGKVIIYIILRLIEVI